MVVLAMAVGLPIILLQLYRIYVGSLSIEVQMGLGILMSIVSGAVVYLVYRSSAKNQQ